MRAALAGPFLKLGDIKRISDWCSLKKCHILKQPTWIDATWCNHTWLFPISMSRESNSCAECYASSGFVFIISFILYTNYGWLGTIRLAGWQGIYLVTFQNRDSKLCTPLKGNGNPSDAGNYINGIKREVKEQWTSKRSCAMSWSREPQESQEQRNTPFLSA